MGQPPHPKGEAHTNSKLTMEKVTIIRRNDYEMTDTQYARFFRVDTGTVFKARTGLNWASCPEPPRYIITEYVRPKTGPRNKG